MIISKFRKLVVATATLATLTTVGVPAIAQDSESLFGVERRGMVSYGPYLRFDIGASMTDFQNENWRPPGYPADPQVFFDFSGQNVVSGTIAYGYDWMNGFRGEIALTGVGNQTFSGDWTHDSNGDTNPTGGVDHAAITSATVSSTTVIGSVVFSPLLHQGNNQRFQPFLTAGLGVANNKVGEWTRFRAAATNPTRTFSGANTTSLAWMLGVGFSWDISDSVGSLPMFLEMAYRFQHLGLAQGGSTSLGAGTSTPVRPISFNNINQTVTIGIRIPIQKG